MKPALAIAAAVLATAAAASGWTAYLVRPAAVHTITPHKDGHGHRDQHAETGH